MAPKFFNSTAIYYFLVFMLFISLSAVILSVVTHSKDGVDHSIKKVFAGDDQNVHTAAGQIDTKFDPKKYLPTGASLSNLERNVVFADLAGDGRQEVVIFYTVLNGNDHQANILVLKPTAAGYDRLWEDVNNLGTEFANPSGVLDMNGNGRPQIVAYRIVGASCPGLLDIFQYGKARIEKITGDWAGECQSELEIKDLNSDGVSEIIFRPLKYGINRRIYSWDGKEYVRTEAQHTQYFNDELQRLVGWLHEHRALPTPSRAALCEQAVQIYLLQRRYSEAIELCKAVLPMIDNPELTQPRSVARTQEEQNQLLAFFEVDKIKDKARINRLLGDVLTAAGKPPSANKYYTEAKRLESEAAERSARLPF